TQWGVADCDRLTDFSSQAQQRGVILEVNLFSTHFSARWSYSALICTLSLHDALPISGRRGRPGAPRRKTTGPRRGSRRSTPRARSEEHTSELSHDQISYAVFCLKKKKTCSQRTVLVCGFTEL